MTEFTPWSSLFGGVLIGLSAVLLMMLNGRIAGISGIASAILPPWGDDEKAGENSWRLAFVAGLLIAPFVVVVAGDFTTGRGAFDNMAWMAAAGLLTGFGSVFGGGCTSGHGVCGLSRLSMRSIVATAVFMAVAVVTVFIVRHVAGG